MTTKSAAPQKPPSPPWYGGFAVGQIFLVALILLTYTLADFGWQQRLGPWWNYGSVWVLIVGASVMMRRWRPNPSQGQAAQAPSASRA